MRQFQCSLVKVTLDTRARLEGHINDWRHSGLRTDVSSSMPPIDGCVALERATFTTLGRGMVPNYYFSLLVHATRVIGRSEW